MSSNAMTPCGPSYDWPLESQTLSDIISLFHQASSHDSAVQRQLASAVSKLESLVEAPCYFSYIMVDCQQESADVRQRAGLLLKGRIGPLVRVIEQQKKPSQRNNARGEIIDSHNGCNTNQKDSSDSTTKAELQQTLEYKVLEYVKQRVLRSIYDPHKTIRATGGTLLTTIVSAVGAENFSEALPFLLNLLDHENDEIVDGALSALSKVVEDELEVGNSLQLPTSFNNDGRINYPQPNVFVDFCSTKLIPKLFSLTTPQSALLKRQHAILCLNHFQKRHLFCPGDMFGDFFPMYWSTLGQLALDPTADIRHPVLVGMVQVVIMTPEVVLENLGSLLPFILECMDSRQPYQVKLEALEFTVNILKEPGSREFISQALPQLVPMLVDNAKYSEWDYMQMDQSQIEVDNASLPDTAQDIQPRFHKSHHHGGGDNSDNDDDDDDGDDDTVKSTWGSGWTVRKGAALVLDNLSSLFGDEILPHVLPLIESKLQSGDWEIRESAVLTLGAIAHGSLAGLSPFLPKIMELLVGLCDDPKPILRSISVWSLSRFSLWIAPQKEVLQVVTAKILSHILDKNKRVQEASCSAFACLEEEARTALIPYLPDILNAFGQALTTFQARNLLILYDAIGTLADSVGGHLDSPIFFEKIGDPLVLKWQSLPHSDPTVVGMFECITSVAMALRKGLSRYAPQIINHCIILIDQTLMCLDSYKSGLSMERPNREIVECCLDVISAVCEALHSDVTPLLKSTKFLELLERCCSDDVVMLGSNLKQAAFALVGDLSEHSPEVILPAVPRLIPQLSKYVSHGAVSVCNNACWAIGQIAMYLGRGGGMDPFAQTVSRQIIRVIQAPYSHDSLVRNACITLGRLAMVCPQIVSQEIGPAFQLWCGAMEGAINDFEKVFAFNGLLQIIDHNQQLAVDNIPALLESILSFYSIPPPPPPLGPNGGKTDTTSPPKIPKETHEMFKKMVLWLQTSHSTEWKEALPKLKPSSLFLLENSLLK